MEKNEDSKLVITALDDQCIQSPEFPLQTTNWMTVNLKTEAHITNIDLSEWLSAKTVTSILSILHLSFYIGDARIILFFFFFVFIRSHIFFVHWEAYRADNRWAMTGLYSLARHLYIPVVVSCPEYRWIPGSYMSTREIGMHAYGSCNNYRLYWMLWWPVAIFGQPVKHWPDKLSVSLK